MPTVQEISDDLRRLIVQHVGVATLIGASDAEVSDSHPALAALVRATGDVGLADSLAEMIAAAIEELAPLRREIASEYLGMPESPRTVHKVRLKNAAADLGLLERDRGFSISTFRQHVAPQMRDDLANHMLRLAGGAKTTQPTKQRRVATSVEWPLPDHPPRESQAILVLAATPSMRTGPRSPLARLIRELEPYIRLVRPMIYAIDGSYGAIWRAGLLHDYESLVRLPSGVEGGLVYATETILAAKKGRHPASVVYLMDPRDPSSRYPAAHALKRACINEQSPFLSSLPGALRWFRLEWAVRLSDQAERASPALNERLLLSPGEAAVVNPGAAQVESGIALAAHDRHKTTLLRFAAQHREFLTTSFAERFATEISGRLLNGAPIDEAVMRDFGRYDMSDKERERHLVDARAWQKEQRQRSDHDDGDWFRLVTHGRQGGLIQLARRIIDGGLTTCVFFQDSTTPREHEAEVDVLDRATQLPNVDCLTLYDEKSARRWANGHARIRERGARVSDTTLVEAYKRVFGVDLVLAYNGVSYGHPRGAATVRDAGSWTTVTRCAATYVLEAIVAAIQRRHDRLVPVRVGLSWGGAVHDVIAALGAPGERGGALGVREFIERGLRSEGARGRLVRGSSWPPALTDTATATGGAIGPTDLVAVPMVGIMGTVRREIESHALVSSLVGALGGTALNYSEYAFERRVTGSDGREDMPIGASGQLADAWRGLDLALCSCDEIRRDLLSDVVGFPADLHKSLRNAVGEFGHIYLKRGSHQVEAIDYGNYQSTGIPYSLLHQRARADPDCDVVLVAGAQPEREVPAWAALKAGLVSTFITEPRFAWNVLCREYPRRFKRRT